MDSCTNPFRSLTYELRTENKHRKKKINFQQTTRMNKKKINYVKIVLGKKKYENIKDAKSRLPTQMTREINLWKTRNMWVTRPQPAVAESNQYGFIRYLCFIGC